MSDNCQTCGNKHCSLNGKDQKPAYTQCWFGVVHVENFFTSLQEEKEKKFPVREPVSVTTRISLLNVITATGNYPDFLMEDSRYAGSMSGYPNFSSDCIKLDSLYEFEKQLKSNEKILRKHPARKDLFLQNISLRKKIKELKSKEKHHV